MKWKGFATTGRVIMFEKKMKYSIYIGLGLDFVTFLEHKG